MDAAQPRRPDTGEADVIISAPKREAEAMRTAAIEQILALNQLVKQGVLPI